MYIVYARSASRVRLISPIRCHMVNTVKLDWRLVENNAGYPMRFACIVIAMSKWKVNCYVPTVLNENCFSHCSGRGVASAE